jgi:hypothetical protein
MNSSDRDLLQAGYFQWVDHRVEYMLSKGIVPGLFFVWAQSFIEFTQSQFERFCRYIVARYAAYNVVWVISGEYTERANPWDYSYHGQIIDQADPYDHPISIHPTGNHSNSDDFNWFYTADGWLDFIMQQWYGIPDTLNKKIIQERSYGLPVCNDEFGYEGPLESTDPFYHPSNRDSASFRKASWAIAMGGGYLMAGHIWTCTAKEWIIQTDKLNTAGTQYTSHLAHFFKHHIPFRDMAPNNALVSDTTFCLVNSGQDYVVYMPDTNRVSIDLSGETGYFYSYWYNPASGDSIPGGAIHAGSTNTNKSPLEDDSVLHLKFNSDHPIVQIKLLLAGYYDTQGDSLHTLIPTKGYFPLTSPYPEDEKTLFSIPDSISDWILLQFYEQVNGPVIKSYSFCLRNDGHVVSDDGNSSILALNELPAGSYYVRIKHRNHLDIMSAQAVDLTTQNAAFLDFTTTDIHYYGLNGCTELDNGKWAMCAGDINRDGYIDSRDHTCWFHADHNGCQGYCPEDINGDGNVNSNDYHFWYTSAMNGVHREFD